MIRGAHSAPLQVTLWGGPMDGQALTVDPGMSDLHLPCLWDQLPPERRHSGRACRFAYYRKGPDGIYRYVGME